MPPENTEPDADFSKSMQVLLAAAPAPVREFLTGPERDKTIQSIATKYALHVDEAGVFEREVIYLLLGVTTPDEFVANLGDGGIPDATVGSLVGEVNQQIFIRLRAKEQLTQAANPAQPPVPAVYEAPRARSAPMPPPNLPGAPVSVPPMIPSPVAPPAAAPQAAFQTTSPGNPVSPFPSSTPRPTSPALPNIPVPRPTPPMPPIQKTPSIPAALPVVPAISSNIAAQNLPVSPPPAPPPAALPRPEAVPSIQTYAKDPYHEPIDEN